MAVDHRSGSSACSRELVSQFWPLAKIIVTISGGLFEEPPKLVSCAPAMYHTAPLLILRCRPLFFTVRGLV